MEPDSEQLIEVLRVNEADLNVNEADLDQAAWTRAPSVSLTRYWSGANAPAGRHADVRALWTAEALHVRFDCRQTEPLVVSAHPVLTEKTIGLWERDVCEIFIAPDSNEPNRYFEFEAAPTGEWLDLGIRQLPDERQTDWQYSSGMTVSANVEKAKITIEMRLPWEAFPRMPKPAECWRVNFFRCVGGGEDRGYLAWQPTRTERPNFHVPEAFGWLRFRK